MVGKRYRVSRRGSLPLAFEPMSRLGTEPDAFSCFSVGSVVASAGPIALSRSSTSALRPLGKCRPSSRNTIQPGGQPVFPW